MTKEQTAEKKQIKLDVSYRIKRGELKQQIFEDLSPLYKDKVTLVRQIEITPSRAMKSKYGIFNYVLAFFLLAALAVDIVLITKLDTNHWFSNLWYHLMINYITVLSIVLDTVFFVGVLLYRIEIYSWIASRALLTLITLVASASFEKVFDQEIVFVLLLISLGLIVISFIIH